jgi:spermidine synthase
MNSELWIEEKLEDFLGLRIRVDKTLFSGQSEFQSVDVVETRGHGKMLLNDGLVMVTERDEYSYHDMIAHVPLFTHPNPKNVLVIGGGDGGTAREVIRHSSVEKCTMVEIDEMVVNACKEYIPQTSSKLADPKIDLIIGDGVKFVEEAAKKGTKFDVILVDSTDPIGPAQPLFGPEFYENIFKCLSDDGVVVSQGESPFYHSEMQTKLIEIISGIFPVVSLYNFSNMTYPGGLWSFTFASKKHHPVKDFDPTRVEKSSLEFEYYNEAVHRGAFALPNFQLKRVQKFLKD